MGEPYFWPINQYFFRNRTVSQISALLIELASLIDLSKFKKHKRGPKKPPLPKNKFKDKPHVSTAKLLASVS